MSDIEEGCKENLPRLKRLADVDRSIDGEARQQFVQFVRSLILNLFHSFERRIKGCSVLIVCIVGYRISEYARKMMSSLFVSCSSLGKW